MQSELHPQLVGDAFLTPQWILQRHPPDELPRLRWNRWPSRAGLPSPEEPEARSVPANQGLRAHDDQYGAPCEQPGQQRQAFTRVAASIRLGFTPRSTYRASCRRRNRTSASSDWRDRNASATHPTRSVTARTTIERALSTRG